MLFGLACGEDFFKITVHDFLDILILHIYLLILKINNYWGDLTNASATPVSLAVRACVVVS